MLILLLMNYNTDIINGFNIKNLSKLGRDLSIIDNIEEKYQ